MSIVLHTDPRFPCPQRLQLVIEHLNIPLKATIQYNILKAEQKTESLLKVNPGGSVPFIEDEVNGQPIFLSESRAIARYLVSRYGKYSGLIPDASDPAAYAKFEEAAAIEVAAFDPAANPLVLEEHFKPNVFGQEPNQDLVQWHRKRLEIVLDKLNNILKTQPYVAGDDLTLADLFYLPYMRHLVENVCPSCLDDRPYLSAWWALNTELEAYKSVFGYRD